MLKYLLATAGIGFLYVARRHIAALTPTVSGWFAQADIAAMDIFANTPSPTARRFEAGTRGVVVSCVRTRSAPRSMPTTTASTSTPWWQRSSPTAT
jgi:kynureninase